MKKRTVTFGAGIGLVISLAMFISYMAAGDPPDFGMMEVVGYTSMILALAAIFLGIRSRREEEGGVITFGRAAMTGLAIAGVAGLVVGLYTFIHVAWLDPEYGTKYLAYEQQKMVDEGMSQATIASNMADYESMRELYDSPLLQGLIMAAMIFGMGGLISVVSALILSRRGSTGGGRTI